MKHVEEKVYNTLSTVFKHSEFKSDKQREATLEIAKREKNVLVIMPTGAGKSLCYQLPAIALNCLAVVISPLIALIEDQVDFLKSLGVDVRTINSKLPVALRREIYEDLESPDPQTNILYLTPEMITTDKIINILVNLSKRDKLGYIVVDEAHCISQWGHDFRPKYMQITKLRESIPDLFIVAATATANSSVRSDIIENLKIANNVHIVELSAFRRNLFYEIYYKDKFMDQDPIANLVGFIKNSLKTEPKNNVKQGSGIIYCRSRDGCQDLVCDLKMKGVAAEAYHAGITNVNRLRIQSEWMEGKFPVIVATVSFGMGIDKKDVRFVVHWTLPSGIMALYQESGRAGRDGLPAYCRLYYSHKERRSAEFILANSAKSMKNEERVKSLKQQLDCLINLCENYKCRHRGILHYLGEKSFDKCKTQCDVCNAAHVRAQPQVNLANIFKPFHKVKPSTADTFCYGVDEKISQFTSYKRLDNDRYVDKSADENEEKAEMSAMIKRQLKLRSYSTAKKKANSPIKIDDDNESFVLSSNGSEIKDLKKSTRVNSVRQIAENLTENRNIILGNNINQCNEDDELRHSSVNCDAALIEAKITQNSRILSNYFAGVVKTVRSIKDATKNSRLYVISK